MIDETRCINSTTNSQNRENYSLRSQNEVEFQILNENDDDDICMRIPSRPISGKFNPEVTIAKSDIVDKTRVLNGSSSFEKSILDKTTDLNGQSYNLCNDSKKSQTNNNSMNEDPLEGPSWLLNDLTAPIENDSSDSERDDDAKYKGSKINGNQENRTFIPVRTSTKLPSDMEMAKNETPKRGDYNKQVNKENSPEVEMTMNFARFVTKNRGRSAREIVDNFNEIDDPTIMLNIRQQTRKASFDIDDLQMPTIESPVVARPIVEPEITSTINIVAINNMVREPINYLSNVTIPETATPLSDIPISEDELLDDISPILEKKKIPRKRKKQNVGDANLENEQVHNSLENMAKKKKVKHKTNKKDKDPSAAKVVLQKLPSHDRKSDESLR